MMLYYIIEYHIELYWRAYIESPIQQGELYEQRRYRVLYCGAV
jgi:hypothetical protein